MRIRLKCSCGDEIELEDNSSFNAVEDIKHQSELWSVQHQNCYRKMDQKDVVGAVETLMVKTVNEIKELMFRGLVPKGGAPEVDLSADANIGRRLCKQIKEFAGIESEAYSPEGTLANLLDELAKLRVMKEQLADR